MSSLLVKIEDVDLFLPGDISQTLVLHEISWEIKSGEHWAILGPNGSGKSTLLRLLAGELWPAKGKISWQACDGNLEPYPLTGRSITRLVSPKLQASYQRQAWHISGLELVLTGFSSSALMYRDSEKSEEEEVRCLAKKLKAEDLLEGDVATFSQGQLRILLLARALVAKPKLLLLDECSDGLDLNHRNQFFAILEEIASSTTLIIATHRTQHLPSFCQQKKFLNQGFFVPNLPTQSVPHVLEVAQDNNLTVTKPCPSANSKPLFDLKNVTVFIDREPVLHEINWVVRMGEQWLLQGENGSGKSTLLRLLAGDEFCAAGGEITRYMPSLKNGLGGEITSLEELRQTVSLVAPLAESTYGYDLSGLEFVLSGFENSVGIYREYTEAEIELAQELCHKFFIDQDLDLILKRSQMHLSSGQLRRLYLARALVAKPDVLLLDEPCLGLDVFSRALYMDLLNKLALGKVLGKPVTIILISHNVLDIPKCINRKAKLDQGRLEILQ